MEFFTLAELCKKNTPNEKQRQALENLVSTVLDPWRRLVGRLRVTSGLRTSADSARIPGAVKGGQHETGEAVDAVPMDASLSTAWEALGGLPFDQAILYQGDGHIHVSAGPRNRRERLAAVSNGAGGVKYVGM